MKPQVPSVQQSEKPTDVSSNKALDESGSMKTFPPRKRSIPNGFDFDLDEVWWPFCREKQRQKSLSEENDEAFGRTVPTEYYSRHLLLRSDSKNQNGRQSGSDYVISPTMSGSKVGIPVYSVRPGISVLEPLPSWPSRAHDGSANIRSKLSSPDSIGKESPTSNIKDVFHF